MDSRQMNERAPSAKIYGIAQAKGKRLVFNKLSQKDSSGKANLEDDLNGVVWGVLYEVNESDFGELDKYEGGYNCKSIEVTTSEGKSLTVMTYIAHRTVSDLPVYNEYKILIVAGAQEHGLPEDYIKGLESVTAIPKPVG